MDLIWILYLLIGAAIICRPSIARLVFTFLVDNDDTLSPFALGMLTVVTGALLAFGVLLWPIPALGHLIGHFVWKAES